MKNIPSRFNLKIAGIIILAFSVLGINVSFGQNIGEHRFEALNTLLLNSDYESVKVFINDSLYGTTPLELKNFPTGTYNINFVYDTLVVKKFNVEYRKGTFREIYGIFEKGKSLLTVYSKPSSADVFLNDSLIGRTPINKMPLNTGVYNLTVKLDNYSEWKKRLIAHSDLYQFDMRLINQFGLLSIFDGKDHELYIIDDNQEVTGAQSSLKLSVGKHYVSVKSEKYHKDFEESLSIQPDDKLDIKFHYGITNYSPLLYSAIIPGLGQVTDNSKLKGYSIMFTNLLLGGMTFYLDQNYKTKLDDYNNFVSMYKEETNEFLVLRKKQQMLAAFDDADKALKFRNYSIAAFIASYLYNLVDAFLNHSIGGEFIISSEKDMTSTNILLRVEL